MKKLIILINVILLLGSSTSVMAAEVESPQAEKQHSYLNWEEMQQLTYDREEIEGHAARMRGLAEEATEKGDTSKEQEVNTSKEQEVLDLYQQLIDDVNLLDTCYALVYVAYYCDVENEELAAREKEANMEYEEIADKIFAAMDAILQSPYQEVLAQVMTDEEQAQFLGYHEMTDRKRELIEQEADLVQKYDKAIQQSYGAVIDGKEWTWEMFQSGEEEELSDYQAYINIYRTLSKAKYEAIAPIYKELMEVRYELAEIEGYDNYMDYVMQEEYFRDYSVEEVYDLFDAIKKYAVPIWKEALTTYYFTEWDVLEELNNPPEKVLDTVQPYMGQIDESLAEVFGYMREQELLNIEPSNKKGVGGFTIGLPYFGEAFIFNNPDENYLDYKTIIHEFGHFYNFYRNDEPALLARTNLDTAEIHSQGLEILFFEYTADMFGETVGEIYNQVEIIDMISTVVYQAQITEFEMEVYLNPDMTIEEMSRLYSRLTSEYGLDYMGEFEEAYDWVDIPHIFHSPMYCISYVTTALSAMDIFSLEQEDREQAIGIYMELIQLPTGVPYKEAIARCGMRDIFQEKNVKSIMDECRGYLPEVEKDIWYYLYEYYDTIIYIVISICIIQVLSSLAGIITGIVVLYRKAAKKTR